MLSLNLYTFESELCFISIKYDSVFLQTKVVTVDLISHSYLHFIYQTTN